MSRCLVMAERVVTQADRASYLESLAVRRESAAAASAHFWVFEDVKKPGRFLEFIEAGSEDALARAIEAAVDHTSRASVTPPLPCTASQVVWKELAGNSEQGLR